MALYKYYYRGQGPSVNSLKFIIKMSYNNEGDKYIQEEFSYEEDDDEYDEELSYRKLEELRKDNIVEFGYIQTKFFDEIIKDADEANLHKLDLYFKGEEIQLNIALNQAYYSSGYVLIEEDYFLDNINNHKNKFIPNFVFLKDLILNTEKILLYEDKYYLQYNNYIFIVRLKTNKCEIVNYDNCEEIDYVNGKKITNPPVRYNVEWDTYYLVKVYKDNSRYHKNLTKFIKFTFSIQKIDYEKFIINNITKQYHYSLLFILTDLYDFPIIKKILNSKKISIKNLYNIPEVLFLEIIDYIF